MKNGKKGGDLIGLNVEDMKRLAKAMKDVKTKANADAEMARTNPKEYLEKIDKFMQTVGLGMLALQMKLEDDETNFELVVPDLIRSLALIVTGLNVKFEALGYIIDHLVERMEAIESRHDEIEKQTE